MIDRPRVAVLLSTYNGERFLAAQLDSLAAQEGVDVEVFARDDGSSDGTRAILAGYAGRWPALADTDGGGNLGPAASFLALLAGAPEGFDFYAFCDQDDVWLPGKLARAARRLGEVADGPPALYCSRVMCVDEALTPLGEMGNRGEANFGRLLFENVAFGVTVVMTAQARAAIVERPTTGGVIMHDWWCALWACALGTIVRDEEAHVLYRQHGGNVLGASPSRPRELLTRLRALIRNPRGFYPIHAQARAFLSAFGDGLPAVDRQAARALVESRRSFPARARYALSGQVKHGDPIGRLVARLLILADLY